MPATLLPPKKGSRTQTSAPELFTRPETLSVEPFATWRVVAGSKTVPNRKLRPSPSCGQALGEAVHCPVAALTLVDSMSDKLVKPLLASRAVGTVLVEGSGWTIFVACMSTKKKVLFSPL